jgi:hypothetical protein
MGLTCAVILTTSTLRNVGDMKMRRVASDPLTDRYSI